MTKVRDIYWFDMEGVCGVDKAIDLVDEPRMRTEGIVDLPADGGDVWVYVLYTVS